MVLTGPPALGGSGAADQPLLGGGFPELRSLCWGAGGSCCCRRTGRIPGPPGTGREMVLIRAEDGTKAERDDMLIRFNEAVC